MSEMLYKGLWAVQGRESTHLGVPKDGWEALVAEFQAKRKKKVPKEGEAAAVSGGAKEAMPAKRNSMKKTQVQ